jgi:hypothetical protein
MTEKSNPQPSSPQVRSRTLTPYVVGWSAAAALALIYLGLLMMKPTDVASYLTPEAEHSDGSGDPADPIETAVNHATAEVRTLRNTIDLFRNELIELRAQVSSQTEAARDLTTRVAAIEAAPAQMAALTPKERAALAKAEKAKAAEPAQVAAAAAEQKKAKDDKKAAAAKANQPDLETGSVAAPRRRRDHVRPRRRSRPPSPSPVRSRRTRPRLKTPTGRWASASRPARPSTASA